MPVKETSGTILQLHNVSKTFSGVRVLSNVEMRIAAGKVHCLVGENGAGKSTLIKIIAGAYRPDAGAEIFYLDQQIGHIDPRWALAHGISTIYQEILVLPELTIAENVALGNEPVGAWGGLDKKEIRRQAEEALGLIDVELDVNRKMEELKVAQRQLVAIANALHRKSRVIILDEPTAVFSRVEVKRLFSIIEKVKNEGIGILYISHHLEEIFEIGDYITVLKDGVVTASGDISEYDHELIVQKMVGREINFDQRVESKPGTVPALRVSGLGKSAQFSDISFDVFEGEIVGLAGLVGSGRSEVARTIVGLDTFDSGNVELMGRSIKVGSPGEMLRRGVGLLPESRKEEGVTATRPVIENARYSSIVTESKGLRLPGRNGKSRVKKVLESVSLRCSHLEEEIRYLSGGNQQKVVLTKLLAANPKVMILDEPTRGVDLGARSDIYEKLQEIKATGSAILMISSDLTEVLSQSDRILVMRKGRIVGELSHSDATEEIILRMALGVDATNAINGDLVR